MQRGRQRDRSVALPASTMANTAMPMLPASLMSCISISGFVGCVLHLCTPCRAMFSPPNAVVTRVEGAPPSRADWRGSLECQSVGTESTDGPDGCYVAYQLHHVCAARHGARSTYLHCLRVCFLCGRFCSRSVGYNRVVRAVFMSALMCTWTALQREPLCSMRCRPCSCARHCACYLHRTHVLLGTVAPQSVSAATVF